MRQIIDRLLAKIKPSPREEKKIMLFVSDAIRVAKTISGLDAVVVGSIGKGTWLSGDHDIDIFIIFPKNTPRQELEEKGLEYGKRIVEELNGQASVKYAEHPYTHAVIKGFHVDIVPCYRMEKGEHIVSAVDRSPLHLSYVISHLSPRMKDEVRLLKQFCKAARVYGSDAKHQGFSGYICELLILYYQSFENAIKSAASWAAPQIIDIIGFTDKAKFPDQPLIITDPVDKNRNAAAVVSAENFVRFVSHSKQFLAKPNANFFNPRPIESLTAKQIRYLLNRGTRFIAIKMAKPDVIDDVLYPQLRKTLKRLGKLLEHNEFSAIRSHEFVGGHCYLIFELEIFELPPVNNMIGPPLSSKHHTQEFLSKYRGRNFLYISDNRWVAEVKRQHRTALDLLNAFLKREKEKLVADGIPNHIADVVVNCTILEQEKFFAQVKADKHLSDFLRERYFVDMGKNCS